MSLESVLLNNKLYEVEPLDFYKDVFKLGYHYIQSSTDKKTMRTSPLAYAKNDNEKRGRYRILFDDDFEETLSYLQQFDFAIMNGITYFGRKNIMANASKMYAMIFDIDGVTDDTLNNFLFTCTSSLHLYPSPNYIVLSGHGVHLYYVFEEPISLYPNVKMQLKDLKYHLTSLIWNRYTSEDKNIQYQGINQGFRIVGSKTKIRGVKVRAFAFNPTPITMEYLNQYAPEKKQVDINKFYKESKMTLAEAKKKYPVWYEKRVLNNEPKGHWTCKDDLYKWWLRRILDDEGGASFGHRYFCVMCLAIYAAKCDVPFEQLKKDAYKLRRPFNQLNKQEPFKKADIDSALDCYDEKYATFPIKDIMKLSGIQIKRNKRNGRTRKTHIKSVNNTRKFRRDELGEDEYKNNGRPKGSGTKEQLIIDYLMAHPDEENVSKIARECRVARNTVYKYLEGK